MIVKIKRKEESDKNKKRKVEAMEGNEAHTRTLVKSLGNPDK
jgi:hypothetical protein